MSRLGSFQISSRMKEPLVPGQSVKSSLLAQGGRWLGLSTDVVRKLPQKIREAPSLTGAGVSVFPLSLWRWEFSPDSAVMGASDARQGVGHEGPQSVRLQGNWTCSPCWGSSPTEQVLFPLVLSTVSPSLPSPFPLPSQLLSKTHTLHMTLWTLSREGKREEAVWVTHGKTHHTWERSGAQANGSHTGLSRSSNSCPGVLVLNPRSGEQACLIWVVHLITKSSWKRRWCEDRRRGSFEDAAGFECGGRPRSQGMQGLQLSMQKRQRLGPCPRSLERGPANILVIQGQPISDFSLQSCQSLFPKAVIHYFISKRKWYSIS